MRRFLTEKSPETEVRRLMDTTEGYDPAVWSQMAEQLGLQSLTIPEEFGGSGFTYVELIVVLEEMGGPCCARPIFSTVALAANALLTSGDDAAKKDYLPGHRLGRDDRHPGPHRGQRDDGTSSGIDAGGDAEDGGWVAQRPQDVRDRRPRGRPRPRRRPHAPPACRSSRCEGTPSG